MGGGQIEAPARVAPQPGRGGPLCDCGGHPKDSTKQELLPMGGTPLGGGYDPGRAVGGIANQERACPFAPIFAELDGLDNVIADFQECCEHVGAFTSGLADPAPDVRYLRPTVTIPGDAWQHLEAIRGLTWAVRKLAEDVARRGAGHD